MKVKLFTLSLFFLLLLTSCEPEPKKGSVSLAEVDPPVGSAVSTKYNTETLALGFSNHQRFRALSKEDKIAYIFKYGYLTSEFEEKNNIFSLSEYIKVDHRDPRNENIDKGNELIYTFTFENGSEFTVFVFGRWRED